MLANLLPPLTLDMPKLPSATAAPEQYIKPLSVPNARACRAMKIDWMSNPGPGAAAKLDAWLFFESQPGKVFPPFPTRTVG